jgi:hypothetical protein
MGGRHVQSPQQIQPTGESRYRHIRVRRRDARWRRRGSVIDAYLNVHRGEALERNARAAWHAGPHCMAPRLAIQARSGGNPVLTTSGIIASH